MGISNTSKRKTQKGSEKVNQVRIISGDFGGRLIATPRNKVTHPMGDRERSAVFNMLRGAVEQAVVLDAFAGSGALGLEALSRAAKSVDFLENDKKALATIRENIEKLGLEGKTRVVQRLGQITGDYDVIFSDAPYDKPQYSMVMKIAELLRSGGIMVLSHSKEARPPEFAGLSLIADRSYAAAQIKIYQRY
jgi:16S rRNA (guanine966-N2)-methyltransferase